MEIKRKALEKTIDQSSQMEAAPTIWRPSTPDEKLAALVAYTTGDGSIHASRYTYRRKDGGVSDYGRKLQCAFYSNHQADLHHMLNDCLSLGLTEAATVKPKKTPEGYAQSYQLQLSARASERLVEAGSPAGAKTEQEFPIPHWVASGSDGVKRAYLAALLGAEGTAPTIDRSSKSRLPRSLVLTMCKKKGFSADGFFKGLQTLASDLGVASTVSVSVRGDGYQTYTLRIGGGLENVVKFFTGIGFVYCDRKATLAWQWAQYLRAYDFAAQRRRTLVMAKKEGETFSELGSKLGISAGAAHRLRQDAMSGKGVTAGRAFPRFPEWMAERWNEEQGVLRLAVVKKKPASGLAAC